MAMETNVLILLLVTGVFVLLFLLLQSGNVLTPLYALVEMGIRVRAGIRVTAEVGRMAVREWVRLYPKRERAVRKEHGNGKRENVRRSGPGDIRVDAGREGREERERGKERKTAGVSASERLMS